MTLKISISGIRGIAGQSLLPKVVKDFSLAFADYLKNSRHSVVVGSDTRMSKDWIKEVIISTLGSKGIEVIDIGIASTPTTQIAVRDLKADGGIVITASHNPPQWNGMKFIRADGIFLNEEEATGLISKYEEISASIYPDHTSIKKISGKNNGAIKRHIDHVLDNLDVASIIKKGFRVAIDCCNGAGSEITPMFLKELGCEIISINTDIEKIPPRGSEPTPDNINDLAKIVEKLGADIGFAQDPDADRLSVISEKGIAIGEEYTLVLAAKFILSRVPKGQTVATNLSTSRMIEDIAGDYGAKVVRTKVGEVNVSERMKKENSPIGGEGNGGVIFSKVGLGRDSISGIGIILNLLAAEGLPVSEIVKSIPRYEMIKDKIQMSDPVAIRSLLEKVEQKYISQKIDRTDGLKIDLDHGWIHIRGSNTEPIVRIIAEGRDIDSARHIIEEVRALS